MVANGLGGLQEKEGVTANGYRISFWGNENVLKLISIDGCITLHILKTIELHI